jgi:hypothetical protein
MYSDVKIIFHFSYFDPDYPTFGLTVTGLMRVYCIKGKCYHSYMSILQAFLSKGTCHGVKEYVRSSLFYWAKWELYLVNPFLSSAGRLLTLFFL